MITVQFKIAPTAEQEKILLLSMSEYIRCVNKLVSELSDAKQPVKQQRATLDERPRPQSKPSYCQFR